MIWSSYISMLILGLIDNMRGPFYPEVLAEYMVGVDRGSFFFAIVSAMAFCGSLLGHRIIQRWSSVHLMTLSTVGLSAGFAAIALAPTFEWMLVACGVFGLAFGGLNLSQNVVVSEFAASHSRRRIFNGLHSMYGLAALVAPLLATLFRHINLDWRKSFLIMAALPLLWLIGAWYTLPVKTRGHERHATANLTSNEWTVVLLYSIFISAYLWGEISLSTRMVQWMRSDLGMNPDPANFYMGAFFALFLIGRLLFSVLHFSGWGNWQILRYSSLSAAVFMFLGLEYHPAFLPLSGLAMAPFYPTAMEQINSRFAEKRSQALGFIIGFGSLAVVGMHLLLGWAGAEWGLTNSLLLCAACLGAVYVALQARALFDSAR